MIFHIATPAPRDYPTHGAWAWPHLPSPTILVSGNEVHATPGAPQLIRSDLADKVILPREIFSQKFFAEGQWSHIQPMEAFAQRFLAGGCAPAAA